MTGISREYALSSLAYDIVDNEDRYKWENEYALPDEPYVPDVMLVKLVCNDAQYFMDLGLITLEDFYRILKDPESFLS